MTKKIVLFIIILAGMVALNAGFFNSRSKVDYVKKPSAILMMGNQHENVISMIQGKIKELQQKNGTEKDVQAANNLLQQIAGQDTIQANDTALINKLMEAFKNKKATIDKGDLRRPKGGMIITMQFAYNENLKQQTEEDVENNVKQGYLPLLYLFPNNILIFPIYDKNADSPLTRAEIRLDNATAKDIRNYYDSHVNKTK